MLIAVPAIAQVEEAAAAVRQAPTLAAYLTARELLVEALLEALDESVAFWTA